MSTDFPLRPVAPAAFAELRRFLAESGLDEAFLLHHFSAVSLHELLFAKGSRRQQLDELYHGPATRLFLARLFCGGMAVTAAELEQHVPASIRQTLRDTGLLNNDLRCPVLLHPAFGLYVASDRSSYEGDDFVMSGAEGLCRQFIRYVGTEPCGTFLDMGSGAGIAAMRAASFAREVWAVDIVPRAVRYAQWNCQLNGIHNVHVLEGDLFAPVHGLRFDRIACNPPFEPSLTGDVVFSCGGEDGEAILARFIAEVPAYLAPGGRLYCQVEGSDREGETLDQRIIRWLGDAAARHDTALFVRSSYAPLDFAAQQAALANQDAAGVEQWAELYQRLRATAVIIGHLILQRHDGARLSFHRRSQLHSDAEIPHLESCFDRETAMVQDEAEWPHLRPAPAPGWELHVRHRMHGSDLRPHRYAFVTQAPLRGEWEVPAWLARLVSRCDAVITAEQHARWAETNASVPPHEFYSWLRTMLWAGVLALPAIEEQS